MTLPPQRTLSERKAVTQCFDHRVWRDDIVEGRIELLDAERHAGRRWLSLRACETQRDEEGKQNGERTFLHLSSRLPRCGHPAARMPYGWATVSAGMLGSGPVIPLNARSAATASGRSCRPLRSFRDTATSNGVLPSRFLASILAPFSTR